MITPTLAHEVRPEAGKLPENANQWPPRRPNANFIADAFDLQFNIGTLIGKFSWNQNGL
jgi:hypothetical protein